MLKVLHHCFLPACSPSACVQAKFWQMSDAHVHVFYNHHILDRTTERTEELFMYYQAIQKWENPILRPHNKRTKFNWDPQMLNEQDGFSKSLSFGARDQIPCLILLLPTSSRKMIEYPNSQCLCLFSVPISVICMQSLGREEFCCSMENQAFTVSYFKSCKYY